MTETNTVAEHMVKETINEECNGCSKVAEDSTCSAYPKPSVWWRRGRCPLADHVDVKQVNNGEKVRVGQQKQRRKRRGR